MSCSEIIFPAAHDEHGREVAAVRGVLASMRAMVRDGATHIGVATDHIIESFRNKLWAGYKTGEGIDPVLFAQFPLLEEALTTAGIVVWPMVEYEAGRRFPRPSRLGCKVGGSGTRESPFRQ
jgi:hypothetical protein